MLNDAVRGDQTWGRGAHDPLQSGLGQDNRIWEFCQLQVPQLFSALSVRPCLTTVTQGLFLPFVLLSDSGILGGCAPYPNKPCVAVREHGLLQKNKLILHMWNQAPNLCEQGKLQPPAGTVPGMPYQKELGVLQGSWLGW